MNKKIMILIIVIILGMLAGAIVLLGLIMPKQYSIAADIEIAVPSDVVFDFVKQLRNQEQYSKWVMADPNVKMTYTGTDGTVGFKAAWVSDDKNVGVGEQEIIKIEDGKRYDVEIRFEKPFKGTSYAHTTTEALPGNKTRVTTTFNTTTPFPMNLMVPMMKKMLTKDMNQNARKLKEVLER